MGCHRWATEINILVEKRHGYQLEHCFSENWNAMKRFHYLMRMVHLLNIFAHHLIYLYEKVKELGVRGLIDFVRSTLSGPWLDLDRIGKIMNRKFQLKMI